MNQLRYHITMAAADLTAALAETYLGDDPLSSDAVNSRLLAAINNANKALEQVAQAQWRVQAN